MNRTVSYFKISFRFLATFKSVLGKEWTCRYLGSERLLSNLDWLLSKYFSSQNVGNLVPIFSSTNCHQISMKKLPHFFLQPHIILAKDTHWICSDSSIFRHACPIWPVKFEFRKKKKPDIASLPLWISVFGYNPDILSSKMCELVFDCECDDNIELHTDGFIWPRRDDQRWSIIRLSFVFVSDSDLYLFLILIQYLSRSRKKQILMALYGQEETISTGASSACRRGK